MEQVGEGLAAQAPSTITRDTIKSEIEKAIYDRLSAHRSFVAQELSANWALSKLQDETLPAFIDAINDEMVSADHFSIHIEWRFLQKFAHFFFATKASERKKTEELKIKHTPEAIQFIKTTVLKDIQQFLLKLQTSHAEKFKPAVVTKLIGMVLNNLQDKELEIKEQNFQFTCLPSLLAKLIVHVFKYAYPIICKLQEHYDEECGYLAKLKSYRETLWKLLKNNCDDRSDEIIAADFFCDHLKGKIKQQATDTISKAVKMEIRRMYETKQFLMQTLMADLADKANISDYLAYIRDPEDFAAKWLEIMGNKHFSSGKLTAMAIETTEKISDKIRLCFTAIVA